MTVEWICYQRAIDDTRDKRRHLLLGNGFSVGVHRRFSYTSLFEQARREDTTIELLFNGHGTNFEAALQAAKSSEERRKIRIALIAAITKVHPRSQFLDSEKCYACGKFLEDFAGFRRNELRGKVFTTNYDMFTYRVLMQNKKILDLQDGCDNRGLWGEERLKRTSLFYLHGALHLFLEPIGNRRPYVYQTWKVMYDEEGGRPILLQIRDRVERGRFPLFVSEGKSEQKAHRIERNLYLKTASRSLGRACIEPNAALFTIGHSLADVDKHITDLIGAGTATVYIGVHRPAGDDGAQALKVARRWAETRSANLPPLRVRLFDSSECPIWSPQTENVTAPEPFLNTG